MFPRCLKNIWRIFAYCSCAAVLQAPFSLGETNSEFIRLMEERTVAMHPPPISNDCHPEWAELSWIMETKAIKHHLGSTTMEGFSEHSLRVFFLDTWGSETLDINQFFSWESLATDSYVFLTRLFPHLFANMPWAFTKKKKHGQPFSLQVKDQLK